MPSLRQILVDAVAMGLVGIGLAAAASGYLHNLPDPGAGRVAISDEPLTTGSVAPRGRAEAEEAERAEAEELRDWIDPPLRTSRPAHHRPS